MAKWKNEDSLRIEGPRLAILEPLQRAFTFTRARSPKPILANVLLKAVGGGGPAFCLMATDLEASLMMTASGMEVQRPGEILVPPRILKILSASSSEQVVLSGSESGIELATADGRFTACTEPVAEFPSLSDHCKEPCLECEPAALCGAIRRTIFAADTVESKRYVLDALHLEAGEGRLTVVGTDGRRMAVQKIAAGGSTDSLVANVPSRAAALIGRTFSDSDGPIRLWSDANWLAAWDVSRAVSVRLAEGRYPVWADVMPAFPPAFGCQMPCGPLATALRQIAATIDDPLETSIGLRLAEGALRVMASTQQGTGGEISVPVAYGLDACEVRFRIDNIQDAVGVLPPDATITLGFSKQDDGPIPLQISTEDGFLFVAMPVEK
jgi:DNA polymerase-3 subunit beta